MTTIELIRTDLLAGDHTIGVAHQQYATPLGIRGHLVATRFRRGSHGYGTECTSFAEADRDAAIRWYMLGDERPRPGTTEQPTILWQSSEGRHRITWEDPTLAEREQLAEDLARWAGADAEREHDEAIEAGRANGAQHYTNCCMQANEDGARNEYAFALELPLDKLRARHASSLAERGGRS